MTTMQSAAEGRGRRAHSPGKKDASSHSPERERRLINGLVTGTTIGHLQTWVPGTKAADTVRFRGTLHLTGGGSSHASPRTVSGVRVLRSGLVLAGRSMQAGYETN